MVSAHPWPAFFHVFFKVAAVVVYLVVGFFSSSFVINFVLCVLLLSLDFWTVRAAFTTGPPLALLVRS